MATTPGHEIAIVRRRLWRLLRPYGPGPQAHRSDDPPVHFPGNGQPHKEIEPCVPAAHIVFQADGDDAEGLPTNGTSSASPGETANGQE